MRLKDHLQSDNRSKLVRFKVQFFKIKRISSLELFSPQCKNRLSFKCFNETNTLGFCSTSRQIIFHKIAVFLIPKIIPALDRQPEQRQEVERGDERPGVNIL